MAFSATDAAFEGFRLVRRNPLALVAWTLLYAVLTLTALFSLSGMVGALEAWSVQAEALEGVDKPSLEQVMAVASGDRKSTRLNSSHLARSRMPSSA